MLRRMQISLTGLMQQANKHNLDSELILVEWNPVPDRPRLYQALSWSEETSRCKVRIITVPPDVHNRFHHSEKVSLFQMIAKNVGIRRARGHFVLATNIDVLFSEELFDFLASKTLDSQYLYRVDRYDVPGGVPTNVTYQQQLDYCRNSVIRVNRRDGTYPQEALRWIWAWRIRLGLSLLSRFARHLIRGSVKIHDELIVKTTTASRLPKFTASRPVDRADLFRIAIRFLKERVFSPYPKLHTNASGDFTLLAREHWHALRGYPELEVHSFYLDFIFCHMAYHHGLQEKILQDPMRIYHMEHGSGWTPQEDDRMKQRLIIAGIPLVEFRSWITKMQKEKRPMILNDEEWGLASENLLEISLNRCQYRAEPVVNEKGADQSGGQSCNT